VPDNAADPARDEEDPDRIGVRCIRRGLLHDLNVETSKGPVPSGAGESVGCLNLSVVGSIVGQASDAEDVKSRARTRAGLPNDNSTRFRDSPSRCLSLRVYRGAVKRFRDPCLSEQPVQ
jgi:hypothetical protein